MLLAFNSPLLCLTANTDRNPTCSRAPTQKLVASFRYLLQLAYGGRGPPGPQGVYASSLRFLRRCPRSTVLPIHGYPYGLYRSVDASSKDRSDYTGVKGEGPFKDLHYRCSVDGVVDGSMWLSWQCSGLRLLAPEANHMHVFFFAVARFRPALSHNSTSARPRRWSTRSCIFIDCL